MHSFFIDTDIQLLMIFMKHFRVESAIERLYFADKKRKSLKIKPINCLY